MLVRYANIEDFEFIYKCINELEEQEFDRDIQLQILEQNLTNPRHIYLIAERDGKSIGFLSCHCQYLLHHGGLIGEIEEMFVMPEFRSQKTGSQLLEELTLIAYEKGVLQIEVTSNIKRASAHRFYLQNGFQSTHKKFTRQL